MSGMADSPDTMTAPDVRTRAWPPGTTPALDAEPDEPTEPTPEPEPGTEEYTFERRAARPQISAESLRELAPVRGWNKGGKVCIVGFTDHRKLAPFDDPEFSIWGCNKLWQLDDRPYDRIYDPHPLGDIRKGDPAQAEWLTKTQTPVYVVKAQPDWPTSITLPHEVLRTSRDYFTNTISWMIAHALYEGPPSELWVVGVDMATNTEWAGQRPSCEYWLGVAEAMGVKVRLPMESDLLKCAVAYGVEEDSAYFYKKKARMAELQARQQQVQGELGQLDSSYNAQRLQMVNMIGQCQGAIEQISYDLNVWHPPRTSADADKRLLMASDGKAD